MVNTTRKKKNTTSRGKGSSRRSRAKKSGSSGGIWVVYALLFAVLCGAGFYFYENGLPFDINKFKWDTSEEVVASSHSETKDKSDATKKVQREEKKVNKEKPSVPSTAIKKETEKKSAAQQSKNVVKKPVAKKETSKFVAPIYKKYHQGRWGYTVVYPSFLTQEIRSANNDGCHFADHEGTEFITYGSWNVTEATIKELYREKLDDNMKVTYKRLYKEENYFIKFGYTKDGRMFYMKQVIADKLKEAPVVTGILYFRPESKKGSEEVIKKIFDKFPY